MHMVKETLTASKVKTRSPEFPELHSEAPTIKGFFWCLLETVYEYTHIQLDSICFFNINESNLHKPLHLAFFHQTIYLTDFFSLTGHVALAFFFSINNSAWGSIHQICHN